MKKNILFISISLVLILLLGIGVSYSMWNITVNQDTENVISVSDCFDIAIASEENSVTLKNSYPISDDIGKSLIPFTFKVTNKCDLATSYSINLESLKESTLSSKFLKVMVNNKVPKILEGYDSVSTVNSGSVEARVLDTGILFKNKSKSYEIRLWIDYDTTMKDLDNEIKVLKAKIVVTGIPTNREEPSQMLLTDTLKRVANSDTVDIATDDPDSNIRYIGKEPYNYVYFNCSDYNNQSDSTCEKWRIIGLFNNITKGDGSKENLVKIIRDESIGAFSWDNKDTTTGAENAYGKNDWSTARLNYLLNPGHDSEAIGGSLYWNAKDGTCYYNLNNATTSCDFTSTGLRNDITRNAIESVVWNLGGTSSYKLPDNGLANHFYKYERGTTVYSGNAVTWTGKIGLMYPSDYGYATAGGSTTSRSMCLAKELVNLDSKDFGDCKNNNYLYKSGYTQWQLTTRSDSHNYVFHLNLTGYDGGSGNASTANEIHPTLYLKSNITIKDGNGSSSSPYQLGL